MHHNDKEHSGYVDKVREKTQTYVRRLLTDLDTMRITMAELENENARLQQEVRNAREEIAFRASQEQRLSEKMQEIRAESEQRLMQYAQLEQHNSNLANLYVASYQLHGTVDRAAVVAAIEEIVVNLVGSEEFAICHRDDDGKFRVVAGVGIPHAVDPHGQEEHIAKAIETGERWVRAHENGTTLTACIPLKLDAHVTGYIAIWRLLPHKQALESLDYELFDLLATHAATALYCTSIEERAKVAVG